MDTQVPMSGTYIHALVKVLLCRRLCHFIQDWAAMVECNTLNDSYFVTPELCQGLICPPRVPFRRWESKSPGKDDDLGARFALDMVLYVPHTTLTRGYTSIVLRFSTCSRGGDPDFLANNTGIHIGRVLNLSYQPQLYHGGFILSSKAGTNIKKGDHSSPCPRYCIYYIHQYSLGGCSPVTSSPVFFTL